MADKKFLVSKSKELRKNMTKQERKLWYEFLKDLPLTIKRQKVIGSYIVDFYCFEKKVIIELDGGQHYSPEGKDKDEKRDKFLKEQGYIVLRYADNDVNNNFEGVCQMIDLVVKQSLSQPKG